jgi:hypothetical protein
VDVDGKEMIDLGAVEIARNDSKQKTITDEGKLVREGKDIVDNLIEIFPSNNNNMKYRVFLFQITCNTCIVSTLDLTSNELYASSSQINFVLPRKPDDLDELYNSLEFLLHIKSNMESLALKIKSTLSNGPMGPVESLGVNLQSSSSELTNWTQSTYYTPPSF